MADLKLLITIPEQYAGRPAQAICANRDYQSTIKNPITGEEVANPVNSVDFALSVIMKFLKDEMIAHEVPDLAKADRQSKINEINGMSITVEVIP